jgi:hypothetical protein
MLCSEPHLDFEDASTLALCLFEEFIQEMRPQRPPNAPRKKRKAPLVVAILEARTAGDREKESKLTKAYTKHTTQAALSKAIQRLQPKITEDRERREQAHKRATAALNAPAEKKKLTAEEKKVAGAMRVLTRKRHSTAPIRDRPTTSTKAGRQVKGRLPKGQ